jgi:hypothetical protein
MVMEAEVTRVQDCVGPGLLREPLDDVEVAMGL